MEAEQLVQQLLTALPALLLVAVVETASGQCRAGWSGIEDIAPQQVAPYGATIVRHQQEASETLQLAGETLTEISFLLSTQLHLLQVLPGSQQFVYLIGERTTISLGLARELLRGQLVPE